MKQAAKAAKASASVDPRDRFLPRVAKLDKHKYAAYVDAHVGPTWDMALAALPGAPVRICRKRKEALQLAIELVAMARQRERSQRSSQRSSKR